MVARPRFGLGLVTGVQQPWTAVQTASASACRGLSARAAVESQANARDELLREAVQAAGWTIVDEEIAAVDECGAEVARVIELVRRIAERVRAHADFDDPEENVSGFFDVMGLAMLTGRGWSALRATI